MPYAMLFDGSDYMPHLTFMMQILAVPRHCSHGYMRVDEMARLLFDELLAELSCKSFCFMTSSARSRTRMPVVRKLALSSTSLLRLSSIVPRWSLHATCVLENFLPHKGYKPIVGANTNKPRKSATTFLTLLAGPATGVSGQFSACNST